VKGDCIDQAVGAEHKYASKTSIRHLGYPVKSGAVYLDLHGTGKKEKSAANDRRRFLARTTAP